MTENLQSEMNEANRELDADERQERWDGFARAALIVTAGWVFGSCESRIGTVKYLADEMMRLPKQK